MLIVAMPKTASTSLMETLGIRHAMPRQQLPLLSNPWPNSSEWQALTHLHSDTREMTEADVERFTKKDTLYKQHILPTAGNLSQLRTHALVVLLRKPIDVVLSYRREALLTKQVPMMWRGVQSESEWLARAEDAGVLSDLRAFDDGWRGRVNALTIEFDRLLENPTLCVAAIEGHLDLPTRNEDVSLEMFRWGRGATSDYRIPQTHSQKVTTRVSKFANAMLSGFNVEVRRKNSQLDGHHNDY